MHQGFATDTMTFDRGTASERRSPADDVVMDLRPRRIPTHDELLILQGIPLNCVVAGKGVPTGQGGEDTGFPEEYGIAVRSLRRPCDECDVDLPLSNPSHVFVR